MKIVSNSKGVSHHFLLPLIAILAVGAIGAYLTFRSNAAVPYEGPQFKQGMVDDGAYVSKTDAPSVVRDYLTGGSSNKYAAAISQGGMRHTVLNVGLRELVSVDPTTRETAYLSDSIESRIQNAVAWNAAHPDQKLTVHLRFHVGGVAPEAWKTICGTVTMTDPQFGVTGVAPRWWVKSEDGLDYPYRDLYQRAMNALAPAVAAINADPATSNIIGTVNAPGQAPNYPESMIIYMSSSETRANLMAGGFTPDEHEAFMTWFPSAAAAFTGVGVEIAINPFQNLGSDGMPMSGVEEKYKDVVAALVAAVGPSRAVVANYSARQEYASRGATGPMVNLYNWMSEQAQNAENPVWAGVQMARPHNVAKGNSDTNEQWDDVARWAAAKKFHFAETTGGRAKGPPKRPPYGLANIWPNSYSDDGNDITDMKSINAAFAANPSPMSPGTPLEPTTPGYITIMWNRSVWQAATKAGTRVCSDTRGTRTLLQNAEDLKTRGLFGVGGVMTGRTPETGNPCYENNAKLASWADMANLRDNYDWRFVSQGKNYLDMTKMSRDSQRYQESGATIAALTSHGHDRAWGAFYYPLGKQNVSAQKVATKYFAFGSKYSSGINTKAKANVFPHVVSTKQVVGGRCSNSRLRCYTMTVKNNTYSTKLSDLVTVLSPSANSWGVVEFSRLVEGKRGTMGAKFSWDCTSRDWRDRWTSEPELYCRESFLNALDSRMAGAVAADPATVAESWGRIPVSRRS